MAERSLSSKKKMLAFADGKVLFVSAAFPPSVGGSVVVMRELLRHYDPDSYNIVSLRSIGNSGDPAFEKRVFRIGARKIRPYVLVYGFAFYRFLLFYLPLVAMQKKSRPEGLFAFTQLLTSFSSVI